MKHRGACRVSVGMSDEPNEPLVRGADPDPASPQHAPVKTANEARGGIETGRIRWVLHISIALAVIAIAVAWLATAHH